MDCKSKLSAEPKSLGLAHVDEDDEEESGCERGVKRFKAKTELPCVELRFSSNAFEVVVSGPDVKENAGIVFQLATAFKAGSEKQEKRSDVR